MTQNGRRWSRFSYHLVAWGAHRRPRRVMAEAIFYLVRSGCAWRMLPRHVPPWPTVHSQLTGWRKGRHATARPDLAGPSMQP
ncbi:transposase [Geminicoccus roseus]|uniref:transposase n=1 Tax=Geminicoccus roseus TaxID=404900 RepID=UPI0038990C67